MGMEIVRELSRLWRRDVALAETGRRSGLTAALWEWCSDSPLSIGAQVPADHYQLSIQTRPFRHEFSRNGRLLYRGWSGAGASRLHAPGTSPHVNLEGNFGCLHLYLPVSHVAASAAEAELPGRLGLELLDPDLQHDPVLAGIGRTLRAEMAAPDPIARLRFELLGQDLVLHLLRRWSNTGGGRPAPKGGLAPWQVRRVLDYLQAHLGEDISLARLAAEARLSTFHFARAFRQSMGTPPHRFLAGLRLDRARQLLETTDLAVTEVAAQVGYQAPQALARVFRRELGQSPGEWRRLRQRP